MYNLFSNISL